ncbi:major paralogous domain-containing protein [Fibrobacter sp. UWB15]|uniref:FISUMP domain-containing protein n=1 Tax=unclassified Fibrobacter TaxID=2634177 RepID=UPI00091CD265|nr:MULTISPECIES: FISUMP domain-containing protein [unclassified Fibrobacter]PWJ66282.1 uncharacterized protein (TIGR02145 family) [Fibrobacter sp. UWB6]SHG35018.1 major paralogous domain-containing protein [Fibrobacter sp. UWB8]SMG19625.1 major paralogous domain-containing protein [Fibrobacter sp. UWB15]
MNYIIASVTKQSIFLTFSILLALLAACGDESSSSVSPEPRHCEEQSDDCDDTSSSSGDVSKNSSSSQKSADKGKSSSSVEKSKSSSSEGKVASSSSKKDENSSSSVEKAKESSSSVKPSSSSEAKSSSSEETKTSSSSGVFDVNAPCTYGDVYVEEVDGEKRAYICYEDGWKRYIPKSSSSSTPKSSSSRGYDSLPSPLHYNMSYGEFTDTRDGTKYATIDIDNKYGPDSVRLAFTVFAQNLKYHDKMVLGTEEQDDDTKVEMYCYNDSIEYCNDWWGGLYQWAEMMALPYECNSKNCADLIDPDGDGFHQGICPKGWHLLSEREMLAASYASGVGVSEIERSNTIKSEISFSLVGGRNLTGMSLIATGYRLNEMDGNKLVVFDHLNKGTYFDFPAEYEAVNAATCRGGAVYSNNAYLAMGDQKRYGVSVRCVKDY